MVQPDWEALRIFAQVAHEGSMSRAAVELGCSVSTVARRIDGLEQALGLTLLHRAQSGAVPTKAGGAILASVDQGARALDQVPRIARNYRRFASRQPVRLSSTEPVINDILMPHIAALRARLPDVLIEFEATNAIVSLEFGATDLAIRLAEPTQSDAVARKLPPVGLSLFISPARLGDRDPGMIALNTEDVVWIDSGYGDIAENRLIETLGIGDRIMLRATSVRALALACAAGQGLAMLPDYMGRAFGLVRLPGHRVPGRQAWMVHHRETHRDPVMRAIRRWVVECFEALAQPPSR